MIYAVDVHCPACGAEPTKPCTDGTEEITPHARRAAIADRANTARGKVSLMGGHEPTPQARVLLAALGEEFKEGLISIGTYAARGRAVIADDRATCRKACCKPTGDA